MVIDGKEVVFFQKKKDVSDRYYEIVKREVNNGIREISSVKQVITSVSKTTDSFYFEVTMTGLQEPIVVSIRTHSPKERKENHIYLLIPKQKTMKGLVESVQKMLMARYNRIAKEEGLKEAVIIKRGLNRKPNKKKSKGKKKSRDGKPILSSMEIESLLQELNKNEDS